MKASASSSTASSLMLASFDYALPPEKIAQTPSQCREQCKLLVLNRKTGRVLHRPFVQLEKYFAPGDVLVINDSRVMPCRLFGRKTTGGKVELLLLEESSPGYWKGLVRNVGWEESAAVRFDSPEWEAVVEPGGHQGVRDIRFNRRNVVDLMEEKGRMPLPPYIKRNNGHCEETHPTKQSGWSTGLLRRMAPRNDMDKARYQTVYADKAGSAAAPTAGLHFTPDFLDALREKGVQVVPITLHVGYGTFRLIESPDITQHTLHAEHYRISRLAARRINEARGRGGKVFGVGTTVVRTLEHAAQADGRIRPGWGSTDLYIYGDYRFKAVDHMITNFHLPKSSLLVLAASFAGQERLMRAYREALARDYLFFSYGDAMLIL